MLTERMTYTEMYAEVAKDLPNAHASLQRRGKDFYREALKSRTFPKVWHVMRYTSPRKNRWLFLVEAPHRNVRKHGILVTMLCTMMTPRGMFVFRPSMKDNDKATLAVYIPHFFQRYAERNGHDDIGADLVARYFRNNTGSAVCCVPEGCENTDGVNIFACGDDGVSMGEALSERMFVYRTFLRYDMAVGWQREAFEKGRAARAERQGFIHGNVSSMVSRMGAGVKSHESVYRNEARTNDKKRGKIF